MSNISTTVQRVRELLVHSGNGTFSQNDLNTMAVEIEQLTESVKQDANTQYAGQYVFSGTLTTTVAVRPGTRKRRIQRQRGHDRPRDRAAARRSA